MILALILPATLLGYLAGGVALILGLGWLASLGVVAVTGTATTLLIAALCTALPRTGLFHRPDTRVLTPPS